MSLQQLLALSPLLTLAITICVLLIAIAFWRNFTATWMIACTGLVATLGAVILAAPLAPIMVTPLIRIDGFSLLFSFLLTATSLGIALLASDYFKGRDEKQDEFYVLMLSSTLGALTLVCSVHFASFILGLELLGVSLYAMISYPARGVLGIEAALKYLILSGVSSAFILFGIALLLAVVGSLDFSIIKGFDYQPAGNHRIILLTSMVLILAGLMFKLSLVPFHLWTPDVYQGAPAPVSAFVATVSKVAIFAALLRFFAVTELYHYEPVILALTIVAILSMVVGNLLALLQDNVKRILAYSSIAHVGYLMVAFIAMGSATDQALTIEACTFFLIAYLISTIGAFGVVTILSIDDHDRDLDRMADYRGLFWRRPLLATIFSGMLLSLAGIPLTAGFIGKFYIFVAGVHTHLWLLVSTVILGSAIGLFYYLRIIFNMTERMESVAQRRMPIAGAGVMISLAGLLIMLGQ